MKTIFAGIRVTDPDRSFRFYTALGYHKVGQIDFEDGSRLIMLRFPDEPATTLELVHRPGEFTGGGLDHLAIQVDSITDTIRDLTAAGLEPGAAQFPGGSDGPKTSEIIDPDGYRIELVEWPPGHDGITDADFS